MITKKLHYLRLSLFILIMNTLYNLSYSYVKSQERLFVVHHLQNMTGLHFIQNKKATLYTNMEISCEEENIQYNIGPLWKKMEIKNSDIVLKHLNKGMNYLSFGNKKIIQIQSDSLNQFESNKKLSVDYVILSNNVNISINRLQQMFNFNFIIFDSSSSFYKVRKWEKDCLENDIPYYSVSNKGAYIESL